MSRYLLIIFCLWPLVAPAKTSRYFKQDRTATIEELRQLAKDSEIPWEIHPSHLQAWNFYWGTHAGRKSVRDALSRSPLLRDLVIQKLKAKGLPSALLAVPIIESGLVNLPASKRWGHAAGPWMFQPATARTWGLKVTKQIDQRRDLEASTNAALNMLTSYLEEFKDWTLCLLAYNRGPRAARAAYSNGKLEYVGKITAVAILVQNPQLLN